MNAKSSESTFASGASGIEVRMLIKLAAINQWSLSTLRCQDRVPQRSSGSGPWQW